MPGSPSARMGLQAHSGGDAANTIDSTSAALVAALDSQTAIFSQGALGSRPTSTPGSPGIAGRIYYATDVGITYYDHGTGWMQMGPAPGDIKPVAYATPDEGWLLCDGSAVSRSTYSILFNKIGTAYGAGDGSTTFNVPDLRGRAPYGKGTHTTVDALGESEGAAVGSRSPSHDHGSATGSAGAHTHTVPNTGGPNDTVVINNDPGGGPFETVATDSHIHPVGSTGSAGAHTHPISAAPGSYQVVNYMIKV